MEILRNYVDSVVFGKNFLEIQNFSSAVNFPEFEKEYLKKFNPYYVAAKLPIENLEEVHHLEEYGFSFIETQIRGTLRLKSLLNPITFSPYKLEQITTESDLNSILEIATNTFHHDRFSMDPMIPEGFSGNRYRYLVNQSFERKDEFVYKFFNSQSGEILGFKTHKVLSDNEALMYLGGLLKNIRDPRYPPSVATWN